MANKELTMTHLACILSLVGSMEALKDSLVVSSWPGLFTQLLCQMFLARQVSRTVHTES